MKSYDVVILGGGLAGLTLSLQIKKLRPSTSILVIEMREKSAETAAHKVGESTVELGTYYLREVLGLKDYLIENQLPKEGLRYFFTPSKRGELSERFEMGPTYRPTFPSHQLDRGILENDLIDIAEQKGITVQLSAKVFDVEINPEGNHLVSYYIGEQLNSVEGKWVTDTTGRSNFLQRKLKFQKELDHGINAVWFRVEEEIDIDDWSDNEDWKNKIAPGFRRLATNHLMSQGYWVWVIPLVSGNTSIGIVADPTYHNLKEFNTYPKALEWLKKNEPVAFKHLSKHKEPLDFRVLRHYAHDTERFYSHERWGVSGEAGVFLDPLYSPGTDFIGMNNTFLSDLVVRELNGENIHIRSAVYEQTHKALFDNWVPIYQGQYKLMGSAQVMSVKIVWDWTVYWAVPAIIYVNDGYIDLMALKQLFSTEQGAGRRCGDLNRMVQKMFSDWLDLEKEDVKPQYFDNFDVKFLKYYHEKLMDQLPTNDLVARVEENMKHLEQISSELFRLISNKYNGTPMDILVDPYTMDLTKDYIAPENGISSDPEVLEDVKNMWFYEDELQTA